MVAIAIFSANPMLRRSLEQLPREDPAICLAGIVESPPALLRLAEKHHIDVVLATDAPGRELFVEWQIRYELTAWVVFLSSADEQSSLDALGAGASAILPRSADLTEIVAAIRAVTNGLVVFHREHLPSSLLSKETFSVERANKTFNGDLRLTVREIEVLTAMADGTSNKEIARRLGISVHTVKFHVAAVLEKLDADTRTHAVIKAAQLGIVML
jgi:DNA-binding NarL/FixJ family response regulator